MSHRAPQCSHEELNAHSTDFSRSVFSLFCTAFLWDSVKWPLKYLKWHKNSVGVTILCFSNTHLEGLTHAWRHHNNKQRWISKCYIELECLQCGPVLRKYVNPKILFRFSSSWIGISLCTYLLVYNVHVHKFIWREMHLHVRLAIWVRILLAGCDLLHREGSRTIPLMAQSPCVFTCVLCRTDPYRYSVLTGGAACHSALAANG